MAEHRIKCRDPHFNEVWKKRKKFELRFNDRDYKVGDTVILEQFIKIGNFYTGRKISFIIDHIIYDTDYLKEGFCCMSIENQINDESEFLTNT